MSERESLNGAKKIPGIFSEFYEPLEKIRATFLERKVLPKKCTGPKFNKKVPSYLGRRSPACPPRSDPGS